MNFQFGLYIEDLAATGESANMMSAAQLLVMTAFGKQRRFDGLSPMWVHSTRVGLEVNRCGGDLPTVLAGFCHDLLEDTKVTFGYVERLFGREVAEITQSCTLDEKIYNDDHKKGNDELRGRVRAAGRRAILVKVVDIGDNLDPGSFRSAPGWCRSEMLYCARGWLELGRSSLGRSHPGVEALRSKLETIENNPERRNTL